MMKVLLKTPQIFNFTGRKLQVKKCLLLCFHGHRGRSVEDRKTFTAN